MYRFPDSNEKATLKRRDLLDYYGFIAHVSVLIPLTAIYCGITVSRLRQRRLARKNAQIASFGSNSSSTWRRKLVWWCCGPCEIAGCHLGTRGVLIGAVIWTIWLLVLTFLHTYEDYIHLSGRFGIIAASQLPFHYMLSLKTPYSPLQIVTQTRVENLVEIHKKLGYIITLFFCVHVALYVNFFVQSNLLLGKLMQSYIQCGLIGMIIFATIGMTALKPIRTWSYRVFYISHVILSVLLIPFLYFHGQHMRIYLWETLAVYVFNRVLRFWTKQTYVGTIQKIGGSGLIEVKIPLATRADESRISWQPGQYAYLSIARHPLLGMLRINPFTITSIAGVDEEMRFVARILAGNTSKMTQFHSFEGSLKLAVEGPYGNFSYQKALLNCDRVLFVAGGVGGTFISPLYRQLLLRSRDSPHEDSAIKFDFAWIARSMADISWALPEDEEETQRFTSRIQVYLTRNTSARSSTTEDQPINSEERQMSAARNDDREAIDSFEEKTLLSSNGFDEKSIKKRLPVVAGRPDLARLVERLFSYSETERVALVVCGPPQLARTLRKEVGHWIAKGRDCFWWDETFGL